MNIFLSIPILGRPELNSIQSVYKAILTSKHAVRLYLNLNDSLISRVRNAHISTFYNDFPEAEYYMSIDSDIIIRNDAPSIFEYVPEDCLGMCDEHTNEYMKDTVQHYNEEDFKQEVSTAVPDLPLIPINNIQIKPEGFNVLL